MSGVFVRTKHLEDWSNKPYVSDCISWDYRMSWSSDDTRVAYVFDDVPLRGDCWFYVQNAVPKGEYDVFVTVQYENDIPLTLAKQAAE